MSESFDENGEMLLPGFDGEWEFKRREGNYNPNSTIQQSSQTDEWYTHPEIVELARKLFGGKIDLDPMSCAEANTVVQAKTYYTAEMDGLTRPWFGNLLWNPPWGGAAESAPKRRGVVKLMQAYDAGDVKNAICVANANAITTRWFAPLLGFPVCIPPKRIKHWQPDGSSGSPNTGTIIVYVGVSISRFAEIFGDIGRIMVPFQEVA